MSGANLTQDALRRVADGVGYLVLAAILVRMRAQLPFRLQCQSVRGATLEGLIWCSSPLQSTQMLIATRIHAAMRHHTSLPQLVGAGCLWLSPHQAMAVPAHPRCRVKLRGTTGPFAGQHNSFFDACLTSRPLPQHSESGCCRLLAGLCRHAARVRPPSFAGPPPTWMLGNLVQLMSMGLPEAMQAFAHQYGPVFKVGTLMHGGSCRLQHQYIMPAPSMCSLHASSSRLAGRHCPTFLRPNIPQGAVLTTSAPCRCGRVAQCWLLSKILLVREPSMCAIMFALLSYRIWLVSCPSYEAVDVLLACSGHPAAAAAAACLTL